MKKRFLWFLALTLLLTAALCCMAGSAFAAPKVLPVDVGNFNNYGGSGGSWSGGSGWSGGSSSTGAFFLGSLMGSGGGVGTVVVIIILVVIFMSSARRRGRGNGGGIRDFGNSAMPYVKDNTDIIMSAIVPIDPLFDKDKFLGWTKEVFITLQTAWMERDWSKIRPFEKEELYRQHEIQLQEYINAGRINMIERINVNQAYLHKYERNAEYEYLTIDMQVRMVDYIIDEHTKAVLKGNPNEDSFMQYLLTFTRKTGVKTDPATSNNSVVACPHCGAPTEITSAGKCEYCGFIVTTGDYDWVLSNIMAVQPGVQIDNSGVNIADGPSAGADL